jgi:murein endopeptidase
MNRTRPNLSARRTWGQPDLLDYLKFVGRRAAHQTLIPPDASHPHGGSSRHA